MRRISQPRLAGALAVLAALLSVPAAAQDLIPDRRLVISQDADLPGGDIASYFDTTLEACERACLANRDCTAFTFNTRNNSCFAKAGPGEAAFYQGAYSGIVLAEATGTEDRARIRRGELSFLPDWDITAARSIAESLANDHVTNGWTAEEHMASSAEAEANGDPELASRFAGAAINRSDSADHWAEYARLLLAASQRNTPNGTALLQRSVHAAINAYLRAEAAPLRHNILLGLGEAYERQGRGRDTVQALRLAQALQPRDDTATLLDAAIGKYGFRVLDNEVQSDSDRPRICVNFSEDLVKAGVDYATFVQLPEPGLSVTYDGWRQLCVEGLVHGQRYALTFREGLPAADGQTMAKSVQITSYVRDRSPGVRFPGRGYVLPKGSPESAVPVQTVNTERLELSLFAVTDRNLLRAIQNDYFGAPMNDYLADFFEGEIGTRLWDGSASVPQEVNRDVTTRLPMAEALASQPPGVYALKATVPGVDPYVIGSAWQWFIVTDLGLSTYQGVDGLHVFVRGLGDAGARPGVTLELLSRANAVLGTALTDDTGYAVFDAGLTRGTGGAEPALLVARGPGDDTAFLSLKDPEFDLSDRGVEGREAAPPVDVFLATDRGAYRAGETVHVTALARDPQARAIEGIPLTAILYRPDGVEHSRQVVNDWGGGYVFSLLPGNNAPRGVWRLAMAAGDGGDTLASQTFLVEDFLPERIDFDLALPEGPIAPGDVPDLTVTANYLFGAPGADLAVEGEVLLRAASGLAQWPGYRFGKHDEPFDARMDSLGGDRTDAEGVAVVPVAMPEVEDPQRPLEMRVTVRVAEGSGRPVERRLTRLLSPAAPMIGIKPMFEDVAGENSEARFQLIGVGEAEAAVPMKLRWTLNRVNTRYQWYQSYGNWNWEAVTSRQRVGSGETESGTTPAEIGAMVEWGEYELVVERTDGQPTAASLLFYAGWYAPADASNTPDTLELSLDKPAYRPGETARLRIVPRAAGTALVTVLSNRMVERKVVEVAEGANEIPLAVTEDWGAGVYVTASVLRPMDVAAGRNPARALGLAHAAIDPGPRQLKATVETAAEAAPRGPMEVAVKVEGVAAGETAHVTIAAVDVGILNLTGHVAPDPSAHYFGQRKLGVGIRDVYGRLIDGLSGATGEVRSGGDAGAQARLQSPPPTEELVAYFTGPVEVGADGYARASFDLPSFNGTVKVMAIAWSKTGVGQAQADVLVRDPVVVTASLPRFLQPGDESRLLLEIVHATGPSGRMGLDVSARGLTLGQAPSGFDLADKAKATFAVPVMAGEAGLHTIDVALTTPDGKVLRKTLTVPVQVNDPEVVRVTRLDLASGQSFTFGSDAFAGMMPGSARATLAVGPIARLNAPGILAALDRYPYGCTEQITSRALPLLYFDEVARAMELDGADGLQVRISQAIAEVLANQGSDGAFGLWGPASGDLWLDSFVTDFLSRARAQGYAVPDRAFRDALDNLRNQVNYHPDFDAGGEALAYALMVLAREGAAAVGDLRYYADVKGDAFATAIAQAQLGAALASYGDQPRADAMFRRAAGRMPDLMARETDQIFRADYGTNFRDAAAVLTLAVEAGSEAVDREALTGRISTGGALSTQEATWALMAANALIDKPGMDGITLNGAPVSGPLVKVMDQQAVNPVVVQNGSGADTYLTVTTYGVPSEPEPAGGNGYQIERAYYTLEGEAVSPDGVTVGTRLVTVLTVTPFNRGEARLMVADPLPAGFEIDNPNLISSGSLSSLSWLNAESEVANSEFRQDRFLTAIDRYGSDSFQLAYIVRAVSPGTFHHPAASVEDMYRPDFKARSDSGRITIVE